VKQSPEKESGRPGSFFKHASEEAKGSAGTGRFADGLFRAVIREAGLKQGFPKINERGL
jgi:hypothetical protein